MQLKTNEVLKLENVSKVYGLGNIEVRAVDNVDFSVRNGEILLIMGPSGSGKTTLITMAGLLLRPSSGSIFIDGEDVISLPEAKRRQLRLHKIGFVFQSFNLLANLTALDNVLVPLGLSGVKKDFAKKKAKGLLETFGLSHRADFTPDRLSGGEKQRVSIARSLANDPKLILADEPTANLDSQRGREVMRLLKAVAKNMGKTVVIVSHDHRLMEIADRVVWMEDGRFKDSEYLEEDPNCGMSVEVKEGTPRLDYRGKKHHFCSEGCKEEYIEKNKVPDSYF